MSDYVEGVEETFEVGVQTLAPGYRPAVAPADTARKLAESRDQADQRSRNRATDDLIRQLSAVQNGTAGYREEGVQLWAHCPNVNGGCDDTQERVTGARVTHARTYRDGGDDGPNADRVEKSWTEYDWADPADAPCAKCGTRREITGHARPTYKNESGFDQRALLKLARNFTGGQDGGGTVVQTAQPVPQSPLDALGFRLADGSLSIEEFTQLRAVLEGVESPRSEPEGETLPKGIRRRGERFEGLVYKAESTDGKQHSAGSYDTVAEALSAREASEWLS